MEIEYGMKPINLNFGSDRYCVDFEASVWQEKILYLTWKPCKHLESHYQRKGRNKKVLRINIAYHIYW